MHTREHLRHIGKNLFLRTPGQCGSVLFLRLINRYHPSSFHPAFSVIRFLLITFSCFYAGYLAVLFLRQPRYLTPDQLFIVLLLFVPGNPERTPHPAVPGRLAAFHLVNHPLQYDAQPRPETLQPRPCE